MKHNKDQLTKLADAAFEQAARKVIQRAIEFGTPVIVRVGQEVKALDPRALRNGNKPARPSRTRGRRRK